MIRLAFASGAAMYTGTLILSNRCYNSSSSSGSDVKSPLKDRKRTIEGKWTQDKDRSESMGPFLVGLGVPSFMVWFLDAVSADLEIRFEEDNGFSVDDVTVFGTNSTRLVLGADEVKKSTRTGRKTFMLSGVKDQDDVVTLQCRLTSRGPGWYTRQSFYLLDDSGDFLCERFELEKPTSEENIAVTRVFRRIEEDEFTSGSSRDQSIFPSEKSSGTKKLAWTVAAICAVSAGAYFCFFKKNDSEE